MFKQFVALSLSLGILLSCSAPAFAEQPPQGDTASSSAVTQDEPAAGSDAQLPADGDENLPEDASSTPPASSQEVPEESEPETAQAAPQATGTPPQPEFGPNLDYAVLASYNGANGTYGDNGKPDEVMSNYTDNPGEIAVSGGRKGLVTFSLAGLADVAGWDNAALDLVQSHGQLAYENAELKAYLVEDYALDTVTWNTFPAKLEGTPEVQFKAGGGKYKATRCDITELVQWAAEQGLDHINIALEYVSGGQIWYGTDRYTDASKPEMTLGSYTPVLNLLDAPPAPPAPVFGTNLDAEVLYTYNGANGTYGDRGKADEVMSAYTDNPGEIAAWSGTRKGIVTFALDEAASTLEWDAAGLDLVQTHGKLGYDSVTLKAYLVEDYALDTVTWNTFPAKLEGSPEVEFKAGGEKYSATRCDVTELVRWATEQGLDHINIALEQTSSSKCIYYGTERYPTKPEDVSDNPGIVQGNCTPTLRLLKGAEEPVEKEWTVLYQEDFEDETAGQLPQGWKTGGSGTSAFAVAEEQDGKVLHADANGTEQTASTWCYTFIGEKTEGKAEFSIDFRLNTLDGIPYLGLSSNKKLPSYVVQGIIEKDTGRVYFFGEKPGEVPLATCTVGQWHNMRILMDLDTKKFDLYLDDTLLVENHDILCATNRSDYFSQVMLGVGGGSGATADFDLDNIVVRVEEEVQPPRFEILDGDSNLHPNEMRFLRYIDTEGEQGADASAYTYTTSNEAVATVTADGVMEAVAEGEANITLTAPDGRITSIHVTVTKDDTPEVYNMMKQRWRESVSITDAVDRENEHVQEYIQNLSAKGEELWDTMYKPGTTREFLWDLIYNGVEHTDGGWPVKLQFRNLKTLTEAFVTEGTSLYMDPEVGRTIVDSIEFITGSGEYPNGGWRYDGIFPESGNWWDWQIGASQPFSDILMMMEPYLEDEDILHYTDDILHSYCRDPNSQINVGGGSGSTDSANLTDNTISYLAQALLKADDEMMYRISDDDCMPKAMGIKDGYSSFGEGRYQDGSYICHGKFGYNGGYGADALKGVAFISNIIVGTEYDFPAEVIEPFYDFALEAYLPLLYQGKMMTIVNGRGISRPTPGGQEVLIGCNTLGRMLLLAQNAPEEFRNTVQSVAKYNLQGALKMFDYYGMSENVSTLVNFVNVMEDDSIQPMPYMEGIKMYGAMSRVVQTTDKYTAALAMLRKGDIAGCEGEYRENWHQNAGTLYIYNNDLEQFGEACWPTIDAHRLPGVTTDTTESPWIDGNVNYPDSPYAGGAEDGTNAAIFYSYSADHLRLDVRANKSYFFLPYGIVQMGTGIEGTTEATIETTIENRMLNEDGSNRVLINGEEYTAKGEKTTLQLDAGSWIHMEGNCEGADMAWYFPKAVEIEIQKELCEGNYNEINSGHDSEQYYQWYLKMGFNHGTGEVSNEEYLYVTLPGMSVDEVEEYARNNTLEIVESGEKAHVIKDNNGTTMAVNYWGDQPYHTDWLTLDTDDGKGGASVIVTEDAGLYTLSIADSKYGDATLKVTSDYPMNVQSKDDAITIVDDKTFTVDTTAAGGHSFHITFTLEGKTPTVTWPEASAIHYGQTLADSTLTGGSTRGSFAWAQPDLVPQEGVHSYEVVYTPENGEPVTGEVSVQVDADAPTITVEAPATARPGEKVEVTAQVSNRYNSEVEAPAVSRMTYTLDGEEIEFNGSVTLPDDSALAGKTIVITVYTDAQEGRYEAASAQWELKVESKPEPTATPEPTETPKPTETPDPTATPKPTETPVPTAIPDPSATPEPTATTPPSGGQDTGSGLPATGDNSPLFALAAAAALSVAGVAVLAANKKRGKNS